MKIETTVGDILPAIEWASAAVTAKPYIPALTGVLISSGDGGITVTGANVDTTMTAEVEVPVVDDRGSGDVLVPARLLLDLLRSATASTSLTLISDEHGVEVRLGRSKATLRILDPEGWPQLPDLPEPAAALDAATLGHLLATAARASASVTGHRPQLAVVRCEVGGHGLTVVGTDGSRLSYDKCDVVGMGNGAWSLTTSTVASIVRQLRASAGVTATLLGDETWAGISLGDRTMATRVPATPFPSWRNLLPGAPAMGVTADKADLRAALTRVALFLGEEPLVRHVRLTVAGDLLTFDPIASGRGEITETLDVDVEGLTEIQMGINPGYLMVAVEGVEGDAVRLDIVNAKTGVTVHAPEVEATYRHLVMPTVLKN